MGPSAFDAHCLVYDPTASSRYEVFSIPCFHRRCSACYSSPEPGTADSRRAGCDEPLNELSEWPPLVWALDVYSSSTGRWEERTFHRQGEAAGTIAGMRFDLSGHKCKSVYWRGALYVHYKTCFIMRMSLSDGKYQVIKTPPVVRVNRFPHFSLGASQKGVYLAQVTQPRWLQVWVLDESSDRMEWALKHEKNLNLVLPRQTHYRRWILQDVTGKDKIRQHKERGDEESPEWSSDDDTIDLRRVVQVPHHGYRGNIDVLGFHPHKEIVFLCDALQTGLAYHINTSKIDNLGKLHLAGSYDEVLSNKRFSGAFFPYTPCWLSW
uniref:F-box associated domain-containing protein n=2 Tax=Oryza brachyantha TaxID=4533 RepID=J3LRG7_ORYBR